MRRAGLAWCNQVSTVSQVIRLSWRGREALAALRQQPRYGPKRAFFEFEQVPVLATSRLTPAPVS
jgi:hypothetical protein